MQMGDWIIPVIIGGILLCGVIRGVDVFQEFLAGAAENLKTAVDILPALIALTVAVGMFQASGALDVLTMALAPLLNLLGFPPEAAPLALIRPVSGSGALAVYENLLGTYGPDSFVGRVTSILMGSTETTFYTIAVYYSAVAVKNSRHTLACAAAADFTGFLVSAWMVRFLF